ncbi:MAG: TIGR00270 family protein [Methanomassiliicoccales archaeon]|nr:MAG: TIGR00270 family protein [Methanomassiliicoccales archaeon]
MPCELCGNEKGKLTTVQIEGTMLRVCDECAKFGDNVRGTSKDAPNKIIIQSRLENRERRMKTKDVYQSEEEIIELADDYGERIRKGREAKGWKQEEMAAKINERVSLIQNIERGHIKPDDNLVKKLEKALGIVLMEKVPLIKTEKKAVANKGMTLEDFIKANKK